MGSDLVRAVNLRKIYRLRRFPSPTTRQVIALDGISLVIPRGTTMALTGASGSGKSTLGRCIARLEEPTSGEIWFDDQNISNLRDRHLLPFRKRIQFVFQDAGTALNPYFSAAAIVEEPLVIAGLSVQECRRRALKIMDQVQIPAAWATRRPSEFSGGQRQRLAIARALTLEPQFLILDEALSGVDVSNQAQLVNLLLQLQNALGLTYLFISHDLALLPYVADRVAIMKAGRIVETCGTADVSRRVMHGSAQYSLENNAEGVAGV